MVSKLDIIDPTSEGGLVIVDLVALAEDELAGRSVLAWTYTVGGQESIDATAA